MLDNRFYKKARWIELRNSVLRQAKYVDQLEARNGKMVAANTVHHIFPREKYPEYQWARWNLIAISKATHERLHNRFGEDLSALGWELLMETAQANNIPVSRVVMVVGLPGSGKTTWVRQNMNDSVAYDLDYIAAAFRLRNPHEERHEPARTMANMIVRSFCETAKKYCGIVYIIRTAPTVDEVAEIRPDVLVHCTKMFSIQNRKDYNRLSEKEAAEINYKIKEVKEFCRYNDIEIQEV